MKKIGILWMMAAAIMTLSACSSQASPDSVSLTESDTSAKSSSAAQNSANKKEKITTSSASVNTPLECNVWGIAAKYCTKTQTYVNVPVRITNITRGEQAETLVKQFTSKSSVYSYQAAEKNVEWAVADYEICIDDFPVDEGGTDNTITAFITGENGSEITVGDKLFSTSVIHISNGKYEYDGILKGQLAYKIPQKNKNYVIVLGEYEETQTFFSEASENKNSK